LVLLFDVFIRENADELSMSFISEPACTLLETFEAQQGNPPGVRLLRRFAARKDFLFCHCEERSDEAISWPEVQMSEKFRK